MREGKGGKGLRKGEGPTSKGRGGDVKGGERAEGRKEGRQRERRGKARVVQL